jgi:F-type H+-transporting ATPase subunit delta
MAATVSSKRYAQAIFQIAKEKNSLDQWQAALQQVKVLTQNEQLVDVMEDPRLHFDQKSRIFTELLGKSNQMTLNFVCLLILKNRFRQASQISEQYEILLDEYRGTRRAAVATAMEIGEQAKGKLAKDLEAIAGSKLKIDFSVDPALIGGFIARFDGTLLDGSVKHRLDALRNKLISVTK